ncbi:probable RNA-dependent RNA polymerase 1 [Lolium perenne]|uniref:probable RNA-dependent RNA polymerase 1 n=1 Tax=Lolium perenne TaxID=4522 RepID=UPI0021F61433|nr:probable RNA-dependent RNA polymerase 1 [Lolium perenne]
MGGKTIQVSGFRRTDSAEKVKDLLERVAGAGTVYAAKLRHPRNTSGTSRPYAIVQFQTEAHASLLLLRSTQKNVLRIGGYYLKVRPAEHDIVPRPRTAIFTLRDDAAVLHFGCLLSQGEMSVLWSTGRGVSVEFGFGMKKIYFYLLHNLKKYKLELSYESIWEIQLYLPPSLWSQTKFLVIQVQAAPKIFERSMPCSSAPDFFNYFRDGKDDEWTRTTDFTPSASIGQSYIMCLEVPYLCDLPNIDEYFAYYTTHDSDFHRRRGYPYSCHSRFVPIVKSYYYTDIPYEILFKINHMVQNGILSGPTLDESFFRSVSPSIQCIDHIKLALERLLYRKKTCLNPTSWLSEQYSKYRRSRSRITLPCISLDDDDGLVRVYRAQVTPAKMYFYGPEINVSNRVIRHYAADLDNFLRISFVDEDFEKLRSADISPRSASRRTALYDRIMSVLSDGITIGDKKFEFLAFSSSQLRDNSAWMFASRPGLSASGIRQWMGNFAGIRNVAKYAARLGQSFSASTETLKVEKYEVEEIPDIKNSTKYDFSDGIGKISADCARQVAMKCKLNWFTPSAFQIRYGGYKGVVAVGPGSQWKLSLRKSMLKFESENITLDVLSYSKYQPCFLNRQLISLLSTLGVRDSIFELKQREAVERLNRMITEPQAAIEAVELTPMGEISNTIKGLLCGGYQPDLEPFLSMLLQTMRAFKLLELKMKSRIFIPQGRAMMGCLDETRTLRYGEVFVQASCTAKKDSEKKVVTGKVVVAKNPCLHPGDIRILQAVDVPALHHMVNCVVFPQQGPRPHPNECSGSDLDGDVYFVSWDPDLIPTRVVAPMDYTPAPTEELDHDVRMEEVHEYFANYIVNESLGMIANAHVVFADKDPLKAESKPCIELAKLFSVAVDFPKTGVPAQIPPHLHVKEYPDFMEKHDKETYVSNGVIGKLYREIKWQNPRVDHFTKDVAKRSYDTDLIVDGYQYHIEEAEQFKEDYDVKLGNLMDHYGIKTEAEIISGCVLMMAKNFSRRSDNEAVAGAVRSLRREARSWFGETEDEDEDWRSVQEAKASAWYHVTYHQEYWGRYNQECERPHLISFPWCVCDMLLNIKHRRMRRKRTKT